MSGADLTVAGGTVLTPAGLIAADVTIVDGRITRLRPATGPGSGAPGRPSPAIDATGLMVVPGFIDLQCNGALGVDLSSDPEDLWTVAAALPRWGVTAWLPTIVSAPAGIRRRALAAIRSGPPPGGALGATPLGLHLEGPFLAPERRGAHAPEHLVAPDPGVPTAEGWERDAVALATVAPELPGALAVVEALADRGIVVAAGHSSATAAEARAGIAAGVTYVTHLFNAMAPLHHREPGLAGVALTDDRVTVGLIADGVHVDPAVVALAARALGDRLSLVTDAVAALGLPPGPVRLGTRTAIATAGPDAEPGVEPRAGGAGPGAGGSEPDAGPGAGGAERGAGPGAGGAERGADPGAAGAGRGAEPDAARGTGRGAVRLPDGTLAGSTLALDQAVRNLVSFAGVPLTAAVAAVTSTPARALMLPDRGTIAEGAVADLVLLDDAAGVVATIVAGRLTYERRAGGG
ncbi:MAG TPA: amidohydrolase family protein [Acidimicrobiales bacterium]|nr:amidohydrolase family protein [Acidimicrobiales bacterium]